MFNRAVIASYNNVIRYGVCLRGACIYVPQQRTDLFFLTSSTASIDDTNDVKPRGFFGVTTSTKKEKIYCETPIDGIPKITKEVVYPLADVFTKPDDQTKRAINFHKRPRVSIIDNDGKFDDHIYDTWVAAKKADPKVYQIAFNPNRYRRVFDLRHYGFNTYEKLIFIDKIPYGIISFALEGPRAFELAFLSKFADKSLKIINDQNTCIIGHCLHDLHVNHGIKTVNLGTAAGIKGLAFFKNRYIHTDNVVYSSS